MGLRFDKRIFKYYLWYEVHGDLMAKVKQYVISLFKSFFKSLAMIF